MSVWMAAKQTLTAMDLVTREWASALGLDECGVMVLILLAEKPSRPAHDLAMYSGRARQQVQRSLGMMQEKDYVCPARKSATGRTTAWMLTDRGWRLWECLEPGLKEWDEHLDRVIDVELLTGMLQRMTESMVNRPGADGWRRGLCVPHDLLLTPLDARMQLAGLATDEHAPSEGHSNEHDAESQPGDELVEAALDERLAARAELERELRDPNTDPFWAALCQRLLDETEL